MYGVFIADEGSQFSPKDKPRLYCRRVKLLDLTLPTPAENLACDEALLDHAEATGGDEVLRFWESPDYFVCVGYANRVATEVNIEACRAASIPILRRCTGGGTVVQGPGCLNYALILQIPSPSVTETNRYIMERHRAALGGKIQCDGHTDLVIAGRKFSGNAQRRKRQYLLFHGSFLYNFDIDLITKLLPMPNKQPAYRQNRSHRDFLMNLPLDPATIKEALTGLWDARNEENNSRAGWPSPPLDEGARIAARPAVAPYPAIAQLVREKYATAEWTFKF